MLRRAVVGHTRLIRGPPVRTSRRRFGNDAPGPDGRISAWLFFNGAYPLRLGRLDFRQYIASLENNSLVDRLKHVVSGCKEHDLRIDDVEPRAKDGGAFVKLSYVPPIEGKDEAEKTILEDVRQKVQEEGYRPWWMIGPSEIFFVKGKPWLEDMDRWANNRLRVEFEGAEIPQEQLWDLMRPYGRVRDITPGAKSAEVVFNSIRSASGARNCLHGFTYTLPNGSTTTLRLLYIQKMQAHAAREWMASHPRIVIPILGVLIGTLSYTLFDPIRAYFVQAHIQGTFDLSRYRFISWLRTETLGRLGMQSETSHVATMVEAERQDAEKQVNAWLGDIPETFISVTGPNGSGKTALVQSVMKEQRSVLVIDCETIAKSANNDAKMVSALAKSVGYFPEFGFLASFANLIDLASVGLIGQKAGFTTSVDTQLKQILDVTSTALKRLADKASSDFDRSARNRHARAGAREEHPHLAEKVKAGEAHDGRLATVSGIGAIAELGHGVEGDEQHREKAAILGPRSASVARILGTKEKDDEPSNVDIRGMPVVVMKGFYGSEPQKDLLWDTLADWAAALVENGIAHVVFTSENVGVSKPLTKALPGRPMNTVTLTDASPESALQFISQKLAGYGKEDVLTKDNGRLVEQLGGRLTDLETLVQKIRSGVALEDGVEEIINRSATEIKKNCIGDSEEAAKALAWKREQAWGLIRSLAQQDELLYDDVLINKFSGDDAVLAALEGTELISVLHRDHRESVIRCGKPVYRAAVKRLVQDTHFAAVNDLRLANKALSTAESDIKSSTDQLLSLGQLFQDGRWSFGGSSRVPEEIQTRVDGLLKTIKAAEADAAKAGKEVDRLKAVLKERVAEK